MKARVFHTKFWDDNFIVQLNHKEKLAFIYFFTNNRVELSGAYELPDKIICQDLDLTRTELAAIKAKFSDSNKILFVEGYVILVNARRYSDFSKGNAHQVRALEREISLLPVVVQNILLGRDSTTSPQPVQDGLTSSPGLDNNKYTVISNKKSVIGGVGEIKTFKQFKENPEMIIERVKELHPNKDVEKAFKRFVEANEAKNYNYKNYYQAFCNWVGEDRYNEYRKGSNIRNDLTVKPDEEKLNKYRNLKKTVINNRDL